MLIHSDRSRRGQAAMWFLPLIILGAVGVWFVVTTWQENAQLRAQLSGSKPAGTPAASPAGTATRPVAAPPAATGASATAARTLDAEHKTAMRQVLEGVAGDRKTAWLQVQAGNQEAAAFAEELSGVFKEAGWTTTTSQITGMNLKAGIFFFEAEEESPLYVGTARDALKAAGLEAMEAGGYRSYYEEKKKENPRWVGVEIPAGQDFAIVIGTKPAG